MTSGGGGERGGIKQFRTTELVEQPRAKGLWVVTRLALVLALVPVLALVLAPVLAPAHHWRGSDFLLPVRGRESSGLAPPRE